MGKKLTEEQKALNKDATNARNRAYNARRREYQAAMDEAKNQFEASAEHQAARQADADMDAAIKARNQEVDDLHAQIEALQQKIRDAKVRHEAAIEPLRDARKTTWEQAYAARTTLEGEVKARFPDVANCWSAAVWKPLEDFLPEGAKAAASA